MGYLYTTVYIPLDVKLDKDVGEKLQRGFALLTDDFIVPTFGHSAQVAQRQIRKLSSEGWEIKSSTSIDAGHEFRSAHGGGSSYTTGIFVQFQKHIDD